MRKTRGWWAWGLAVLLLAGCAERKPVPRKPSPPPAQQLGPIDEKARGFYHVVERGENLWRICKTYGVELQQVAELNNIQDVTQIRVGRKIFIPGTARSKRVEPHRPTKGSPQEPIPQIETYRGRITWPLRGAVSSHFGVRNGMRHAGIDISAPLGTPVMAAAAAEVIYRGKLRGYGNILILRHSEDLTTVYAHLKEWRVNENQRVEQGQTVATVGETGAADGSHLHFEVRVWNAARNPLFYLPDQTPGK